MIHYLSALLITLIVPSAGPATQAASAPAKALTAGDYERTIQSGGAARTYRVHVPKTYDPARPTPVVLAYHGGFTNAVIMAAFCGLNDKADKEGFIAVYPNGTGLGKAVLFWNAGLAPPRAGEKRADDVAYSAAVLDDLAGVVNVDPKRVYATGMSNGGMMVYRLAAELSGRIAAIAAVGGTMGDAEPKPARSVPVLHFHGTADTFVPYEGFKDARQTFIRVKSVEDTLSAWARLNGCGKPGAAEKLPDTAADDGTTVTRKVWPAGPSGAEVILYTVQNGGHTWPGRALGAARLGKSTRDISANDIIWEFFKKHPMK
ncbi:MAG: Alpha/beta hydrolase family protein [Planctomycetes bacterium ADurb.Bin126]|nr:MAG: Alpha/beta hydrolase family protein [Planctomycetes bacterium ADurb.Bin126]HOD80690.1 PHB depolymerase family esterase [Phycisphaerae bacterium]HQL74988.1 PHB depolymerase family esterase [Phycisphaerae bacterium]